jgi:hypothetical protein
MPHPIRNINNPMPGQTKTHTPHTHSVTIQTTPTPLVPYPIPTHQPNITLTPCCTGYSVVGLRHSRHHRSFLHLWPKSQRNSIVSRRAPAASREILSQFSFYCRSGLSQVGSWIRLCAVLFVGSFLNSSQVAFSLLSVGSSSMLLCFFIVLYRHPSRPLSHISHLTCSLP